MTTTIEKRIDELFDELVPMEGRAATVAGEIVRAVCRIGYRYNNDGDKIGIDYGRETCNPAARYLMAKIPDAEKVIYDIWEEYSDAAYEAGLDQLCAAVLEYLDQNMGLKQTANTEDYFDYRDPDEDVDYWDEEDEDEEEDEDY